MRERTELQDKIGYCFNDDRLLINALTHSSYTAENDKSYRYNNERLEFLGDAFLDAFIGLKLFNTLPDEKEGVLSRYRASIVCEKALAGIARDIDLGSYLFLGKGEDHTGGREKDSILADALEALIGAVIIDGGYEKGRDVIGKLFAESVRTAVSSKLTKDYKTRLQELIQEKYKNVRIEYKIASELGPDHDKVFVVEVFVHGQMMGRGSGKSKKEAEQNAACDVIMKGEI